MQRTMLFPLAAAFALAAACSDTGRSPVALGVPDFTASGGGGSPHFVKSGMTATKQGFDLIVEFKEAGLQANTDESIEVTANATATYECINGGGKNPSASNKHTVNGEPRADGSFHVDQSGNLTGSLTLSPPGAGDFKCPSGQSLTLSGVTYSQVRVVDLGPTSSGLVAEFDFKGTF